MEWSVARSQLRCLAAVCAGKRTIWTLLRGHCPGARRGTYRGLSDERRQQRYWGVYAKGASIDHWLKYIVGEETPTTDGRIGRAGVVLAEAVYRAHQQGRSIDLPLESD